MSSVTLENLTSALSSMDKTAEEYHPSFESDAVMKMVAKSFDALDADKGGHLDIGELALFAEKTGGKTKVEAKASSEQFLKTADVDGSGSVDYGEFLKFVMEFFDEEDDEQDVVTHLKKSFFPTDYLNELKGKYESS